MRVFVARSDCLRLPILNAGLFPCNDALRLDAFWSSFLAAASTIEVHGVRAVCWPVSAAIELFAVVPVNSPSEPSATFWAFLSVLEDSYITVGLIAEGKSTATNEIAIRSTSP